MRLIMAVSEDGFLARGHDDDMSWTLPMDKKIFKLLTSVGGKLAAGRVTFDLMPKDLDGGRTLYNLSRKSMVLPGFALRHPDAWLVGGPSIATVALKDGHIDEVHLIHNKGVNLISGIHMKTLGDPWPKVQENDFGDVVHQVFKR